MRALVLERPTGKFAGMTAPHAQPFAPGKRLVRHPALLPGWHFTLGRVGNRQPESFCGERTEAAGLWQAGEAGFSKHAKTIVARLLLCNSVNATSRTLAVC